jgi:hypothetical protein
MKIRLLPALAGVAIGFIGGKRQTYSVFSP